ncbi:Uncharacterised protein [Streptococcus pneumoniae]|nr:Uncharacterised protein [Streptococcus pneumoniae]
MTVNTVCTGPGKALNASVNMPNPSAITRITGISAFPIEICSVSKEPDNWLSDPFKLSCIFFAVSAAAPPESCKPFVSFCNLSGPASTTASIPDTASVPKIEDNAAAF